MLITMTRCYYIIALVILLTVAAHSQQEQEVSIDAPESSSVERAVTKSPLGAVVRSAILPGWGQYYNESWLKVPVVWGLMGFLVYGILLEHDRFINYEALYAASITLDRPSGDLRYKQFREFYRDRRDTYAWWAFVSYLVQIADAYVDAALFDFDVSEETALRVLPSPSGLFLQLRF